MYPLNRLISSFDVQTHRQLMMDRQTNMQTLTFGYTTVLMECFLIAIPNFGVSRVQSEPLFLSLARSFCLLNSFYCIRFPRRRLELLLVQFVFLLFPLLTKTE